jgi:putative flippase GtrA
MNTLITLGSYTVAIGAGVRYLPAGAGAFSLGALNGYVLNRAWTFHHGGRRLDSGWRYAVVQLLGLGADVALLWAAVHLAQLGRLPAEVAAAVPVTLMTFSLSRAWVFRTRPPAHPIRTMRVRGPRVMVRTCSPPSRSSGSSSGSSSSSTSFAGRSSRP